MTLRPALAAARADRIAIERRFRKWTPWYAPPYLFHQHPRCFGQAAALYAERRRNLYKREASREAARPFPKQKKP